MIQLFLSIIGSNYTWFVIPKVDSLEYYLKKNLTKVKFNNTFLDIYIYFKMKFFFCKLREYYFSVSYWWIKDTK